MALAPEIVEIHNRSFHANGSPFKIVGANNYYLAFATERMRRAVFAAAKQIGFNVLRAPAYLDCKAAGGGATPEGAWRGVYFQYWNSDTNRPEINGGENGLQRLDHLIADAEQAEIRLILPLVNNWPDFGGMDCYVAWFHGNSRHEFYRTPSIREAYQAYVGQILARKNTVTGRLYKQEPAILAWELANEPRCDARDGGAVLLEWVQTMSRWVKQNDPNHLLGVGDEGYFANASGELYDGRHGVDCTAFLEVPEIDFGTFHLYPQIWRKKDAISFGLQWIEQHLKAGEILGKPMLLEEYGLTLGGARGLTSATERDLVYSAWLRSILVQEGAGDLAWMLASTDNLTGKPYEDFDHYTFYSAQDVPSIAEHAFQMTKGFADEIAPADLTG
jgi:mannan endo-1,4-beta-mannosidase